MSVAVILRAQDVLLFRDGKPFSAGADARARSLFPPTPFTIQGALRARVLFSSGVSPSDFAKAPFDPAVQSLRGKIGFASEGYGGLRIRGPFLARLENGTWTRYFPVLADIVKGEDGYQILQPLESCDPHSGEFASVGKTARIPSNIPDGLLFLWLKTAGRVQAVSGWISEKDLDEYLNGEAPAGVVPEEDFVVRESRFGIGIQGATRTVREGFLYLAEFLRLREDTGFWVEVDGLEPGDLGGQKGLLQLGGEARVARYEIVESRPLPVPPNPLPERFKVVLLTPAYFSEGWKPKDWETFFNGSVQLISGVIPRYQSFGGAFVDDQNRREGFEKRMYRFVPPGSVFYFRSRGPASICKTAWTETPENNADFGQIGFGCFVVGQWKSRKGGHNRVR
ncbi:MAG: type III-B CRISPR module-associated protein Cmr3 [bacterium JZ-2024 1]